MKMITNTMLLAGCLALSNICAVQASGAAGGPSRTARPTLCGSQLQKAVQAASNLPKKRAFLPLGFKEKGRPFAVEFGPQPGKAVKDYTKSFESKDVLKKFIEETIKTAFKKNEEILELLRTLKEGSDGIHVPHEKMKLFHDKLDELVKDAIKSASWKGKGKLTKPYKSLKVGDEVRVLHTNSETDWSVEIQGQVDGKPVMLLVTAEEWEEHFKSLGFGDADINRLKRIWIQRRDKDGKSKWILELIEKQIKKQYLKRVMPKGYWEKGAEITLKNQNTRVHTSTGWTLRPGDRFIVEEDLLDDLRRIRLRHARFPDQKCTMGKSLFDKKYELFSV